jgi:hypothetical protein
MTSQHKFVVLFVYLGKTKTVFGTRREDIARKHAKIARNSDKRNTEIRIESSCPRKATGNTMSVGLWDVEALSSGTILQTSASSSRFDRLS